MGPLRPIRNKGLVPMGQFDDELANLRKTFKRMPAGSSKRILVLEQMKLVVELNQWEPAASAERIRIIEDRIANLETRVGNLQIAVDNLAVK